MDEAERCTKLLYIAYGDVLAQGTASDIIAKAAMHTWQVMGGDLYPIAASLKKAPGVEHVGFFGNKLHVSGRQTDVIENALKSLPSPYQWSKILPGLEDAFLSLVGKVPGET
jgi:ABC-2 type transport system ATP-binding protein